MTVPLLSSGLARAPESRARVSPFGRTILSFPLSAFPAVPELLSEFLFRLQRHRVKSSNCRLISSRWADQHALYTGAHQIARIVLV